MHLVRVDEIQLSVAVTLQDRRPTWETRGSNDGCCPAVNRREFDDPDPDPDSTGLRL